MKRLALSLLVALPLLDMSCAYTTSALSLPGHIKTLAVPTFENGTTETGLEQEVTAAVVQRFVADNKLRIVDERTADAVLRGKVTLYRNTVFGFSQQAQAQEYQVAVAVTVVLKDLVRNREMWKADEMLKTANYYVVDVPGQAARTELEGRKDAIQKIADEILSRSVEGW